MASANSNKLADPEKQLLNSSPSTISQASELRSKKVQTRSTIMARIQYLSFALLLLVTFYVTFTSASQGQSLPKDLTAEDKAFQELLVSIDPISLHNVLHEHLADKYKDGVYQEDKAAMEVVHQSNAEVACSLLELAKRQSSNTTTTPPASTTVAPATSNPPTTTEIPTTSPSSVANTTPTQPSNTVTSTTASASQAQTPTTSQSQSQSQSQGPSQPQSSSMVQTTAQTTAQSSTAVQQSSSDQSSAESSEASTPASSINGTLSDGPAIYPFAPLPMLSSTSASSAVLNSSSMYLASSGYNGKNSTVALTSSLSAYMFEVPTSSVSILPGYTFMTPSMAESSVVLMSSDQNSSSVEYITAPPPSSSLSPTSSLQNTSTSCNSSTYLSSSSILPYVPVTSPIMSNMSKLLPYIPTSSSITANSSTAAANTSAPLPYLPMMTLVPIATSSCQYPSSLSNSTNSIASLSDYGFNISTSGASPTPSSSADSSSVVTSASNKISSTSQEGSFTSAQGQTSSSSPPLSSSSNQGTSSNSPTGADATTSNTPITDKPSSSSSVRSSVTEQTVYTTTLADGAVKTVTSITIVPANEAQATGGSTKTGASASLQTNSASANALNLGLSGVLGAVGLVVMGAL